MANAQQLVSSNEGKVGDSPTPAKDRTPETSQVHSPSTLEY